MIDVNFANLSFTHDRYRLDWIFIGEGYNGEYDDADPEDKRLLRADLYADGEMLDNGSYCTLACIDTPSSVLEIMSNDLFRDLALDPKNFSKRVMELWTWRTKH